MINEGIQTLKKRLLGNTDVEISEVGLGTWQLEGADWGDIDEKQALAILHKAVENGVNFFDTADVYGLGISERSIGKFLKETQETVHIATKLVSCPRNNLTLDERILDAREPRYA